MYLERTHLEIAHYEVLFAGLMFRKNAEGKAIGSSGARLFRSSIRRPLNARPTDTNDEAGGARASCGRDRATPA
jgi:hypothetical protein